MKLRALIVFLLLTGCAWCVESPKKLTAPPPEAFVEPDSISIAVVTARPDDAGFKAFFRTAWTMLRNRSANGSSSFLTLVMGALSSNDSDDVLLGFLPVQVVRVDRLDEEGLPAATLGVTISGWPGLQSLFYSSLTGGPNGPYPIRKVQGSAVVVQQHEGQELEKARAITRVNGTFANFPNLAAAEQVIPRLTQGQADLPEGDLNDILSTLDRARDTYGALINRKNSMYKFLYWLNERDTQRVEQAVGKERMDNILPHVQYLTWQGDMVDDDQMQLTIRFQTDTSEAAEELSEVLKQARETLKTYGRAGELQLATVNQQVMLELTMVGYRKMLQDYLDHGAVRS